MYTSVLDKVWLPIATDQIWCWMMQIVSTEKREMHNMNASHVQQLSGSPGEVHILTPWRNASCCFVNFIISSFPHSVLSHFLNAHFPTSY